MKANQLSVLVITAALVLGMLPTAAIGIGVPGSPSGTAGDATAASVEHQTSAPAGQQLATVIEVTDDEVRGDVEQASFEAELESTADAERAELLVARAATLHEQTDALLAAQRDATDAHRAGNLSTTEFARELAVLNARSTVLIDALENLEDTAEDVPDSALADAGYDRGANRAAIDDLSELTGTGTTALLRQYTGERSGEFSLEIDGGVEIEVENEDGERSREFERDRPGNGTLAIDSEEALEAAQAALATDREGEWLLQSVETDEDDGVYAFEFAFHGPDHVGEAELSVDGATGKVFELEEETEVREGDDDDGEESDGEGLLGITVSNGTAGPGETVTLRVTGDGEPVEGATLEVGDVEGTTDANGELTVTLPEDGVDIEAEDGDREGELELEFDDDALDEDEDEDEEDEEEEDEE